MRTRKLVVFTLVLVVGGVLYWWLHPTEEKKVLKRVNALSARFSKTPGESTGVMALKVNSFGDLFADEVTVDLLAFPGNGVYSGTELTSHVARVRPRFRRIELTFYDVDVRIAPPDRAHVTFTARIVVETADSGVQDDTRELACSMLKGEDETWRFSRFEEIQVLEK